MEHREHQALRARVRVLRENMQSARFEYLQALLSLRSLQRNQDACNRLGRQLKNLLNEQRPKKASKDKA
jgi:hypothetical protein